MRSRPPTWWKSNSSGATAGSLIATMGHGEKSDVLMDDAPETMSEMSYEAGRLTFRVGLPYAAATAALAGYTA